MNSLRPWIPIFPYAVAIAVRAVILWLFPVLLQGDAGDYLILARNLVDGHGYSRCYEAPYPPSTFRPPGYPFLLAALMFVGVGEKLATVLVNWGADLLSMYLLKRWFEVGKSRFSLYAPWIIALLPLLVTYSSAPTTENLGVTLFLFASLLTVQRRFGWAGFFWGVLSLTRSYYLLFPVFLWLLNPWRKSITRKALVPLVLMAFVMPSVWAVRNLETFGKFSLSQPLIAGFQSYQGLCIVGFDWWNPENRDHMIQHPVIGKSIGSHCKTEKELVELDRENRALVRECVQSHPLRTLWAIAVKGVHLFVNWGTLFPYTPVPDGLRAFINLSVFCVWLLIGIRIWKTGNWMEPRAVMAWGSVLYVVLVTIPFAVDARYLLGPFVLTLALYFDRKRS